MPSALILGVSGFSGSALAHRLVRERGMELTGADLSPSPPPGLPLVRYHSLDTTDASSVQQLIRELRPDYIFHLAGVSGGDSERLYRVNFLGGLNLLEAVRSNSPHSKMLLVGSAAEYGRPLRYTHPIVETDPCRPESSYGASKLAQTYAAETYARQQGLSVIVVRPFNILGARMPTSLLLGAVLRRIMEAISRPGTPTIQVGNLDTARDFVAVEDVVEGYWSAMLSRRWGEVFNLCSGVPTSVRRLVEHALSLAPVPVRVEVDPSLVRPNDVPCVFGSNRKAAEAFGFTTTKSVEDCVAEAWRCLSMERRSCA